MLRALSGRSGAALRGLWAFGWLDAPDVKNEDLMPPVLSLMKSESVLYDVAVEPIFLPPFPSAESMQNAAN